MRKPRSKVKQPATLAADAARCEQCGSTALSRTLATYPVPLAGKLAGRRIDVYRVEMDECQDCGALTPTPEGKAKIDRCTKTGIEFFLKHLPKT
jgi:hypothetical protein